MRSRVPRWLGLAALIITAMKFGLPASAQELEPGEEVIEPEIEVPPGGACVDGPPGLYQSDCQTIASDLMAYVPAYKLWSDGAEKERYIYLPPQDPQDPEAPKQPIDASNPDAWVFPVGTRLYKTFLNNTKTKKYETRIIAKEATGWKMTTYAWEDRPAEEQKVATLVTAGVENVFGDTHDIPTQAQCSRCHNSPERVLGFSAIQLSVDGTLGNLIRSGLLEHWANETEAGAMAAAAEGGNEEALNIALEGAIESYRWRATIQGDSTQAEALGYLHANCGHCHNNQFLFGGMSLFSEVLTNLPEDPTVLLPPKGISGICDSAFWVHPDGTEYSAKLQPGDAADSAIIGRMTIRDPGGPTAPKRNQMPPLATEKPDNNDNGSDGIEKVTAWINSLTACPIPTPEVEAPEAVF